MIALDFGLGGFEADIWRVVFLMTRVGAALLAAPGVDANVRDAANAGVRNVTGSAV